MNKSYLSIKPLLTVSMILMIAITINAKESSSSFEPMDVFDLEWATDPRVSPDGELLSMCVNRTIL